MPEDISPQKHPLFAEVIANPDDMAPRLVYADWLEEQGDPRSEFIRIQCRIAELTPEDREFHSLDKEQMKWIKSNRHLGAPKLAKLIRHIKYFRGFVENIRLGIRQFLKHSEEIYDLAPIRETFLTSLSHRTMDAFLSCSSISRLHSLKLSNGELTEENWKSFASSTDFTNLKKFTPTNGVLQDFEMRAVVNFNCIEQLVELNLGSWCTSQEVFSEFVKSPRLSGLENLSLNRSKQLDFATLADPVSLTNLKSVQLVENEISAEIFRLLASSPTFENLRELYFSTNFKTEHDLASDFIRAQPMKLIERLDLQHNHLNDEFVEAIFHQLEWPHLKRVNFEDCSLTQDAANSIASSERLKQLKDLKLSRNAIYDAGAIAICKSQKVSELGILELSTCGLTDETGKAILDADLSMLAHLNMTGNPISREMQLALRRKFGVGVCVFSRPA
ncbi:MAG: TIGR02996 domain-containing protein [Mariniblastus sp.]